MIRWLCLILTIPLRAAAYTIDYSCTYPDRRADGSALTPDQIDRITIFFLLADKIHTLTHQYPDCSGSIELSGEGTADIFAVVYDVEGLSARSDVIVVQLRALRAPGVRFERILSKSRDPP